MVRTDIWRMYATFSAREGLEGWASNNAFLLYLRAPTGAKWYIFWRRLASSLCCNDHWVLIFEFLLFFFFRRFSQLSLIFFTFYLVFYGLVAAPYDPGCYSALRQITHSLQASSVFLVWKGKTKGLPSDCVTKPLAPSQGSDQSRGKPCIGQTCFYFYAKWFS